MYEDGYDMVASVDWSDHMCTTMSKVFGTDLQRVYTVALTQLWVAVTQRQSLLSGTTFARSFDVVQQSFAGFLDSHRLSLICCERIVCRTAFFDIPCPTGGQFSLPCMPTPQCKLRESGLMSLAQHHKHRSPFTSTKTKAQLQKTHKKTVKFTTT